MWPLNFGYLTAQPFPPAGFKPFLQLTHTNFILGLVLTLIINYCSQ